MGATVAIPYIYIYIYIYHMGKSHMGGRAQYIKILKVKYLKWNAEYKESLKKKKKKNNIVKAVGILAK